MRTAGAFVFGVAGETGVVAFAEGRGCGWRAVCFPAELASCESWKGLACKMNIFERFNAGFEGAHAFVHFVGNLAHTGGICIMHGGLRFEFDVYICRIVEREANRREDGEEHRCVVCA